MVPNAWAVWLSLDTAMTQTGRFDAIDEFLPMRYLKVRRRQATARTVPAR